MTSIEKLSKWLEIRNKYGDVYEIELRFGSYEFGKKRGTTFAKFKPNLGPNLFWKLYDTLNLFSANWNDEEISIVGTYDYQEQLRRKGSSSVPGTPGPPRSRIVVRKISYINGEKARTSKYEIKTKAEPIDNYENGIRIGFAKEQDINPKIIEDATKNKITELRIRWRHSQEIPDVDGNKYFRADFTIVQNIIQLTKNVEYLSVWKKLSRNELRDPIFVDTIINNIGHMHNEPLEYLVELEWIGGTPGGVPGGSMTPELFIQKATEITFVQRFMDIYHEKIKKDNADKVNIIGGATNMFLSLIPENIVNEHIVLKIRNRGQMVTPRGRPLFRDITNDVIQLTQSDLSEIEKNPYLVAAKIDGVRILLYVSGNETENGREIIITDSGGKIYTKWYSKSLHEFPETLIDAELIYPKNLVLRSEGDPGILEIGGMGGEEFDQMDAVYQVLDGKGNNNRLVIIPFDIISVSGKYVGNQIADARLMLLMNVIKNLDTNNYVDTIIFNEIINKKLNIKIGWTYKTFYGSKNANILTKSIRVFEEKNTFNLPIDGLVFTPRNKTYWGTIYKWKPVQQLSVDFLVKEDTTVELPVMRIKKGKERTDGKNNERESKKGNDEDDDNFPRVYNLYYQNKSHGTVDELWKSRFGWMISSGIETLPPYIPELFSPREMQKSKKGEPRYVYRHIKGNMKIEDDTIVEFIFDVPNDCWKPLRIRQEKTAEYLEYKHLRSSGKETENIVRANFGNGYRTVMSIWDAIIHPISYDTIIGRDIPDRDEQRDEHRDGDPDRDGDMGRQGRVRSRVDGHGYFQRDIRDDNANIGLRHYNSYLKNEYYVKYMMNSPNHLEIGVGQAEDINRWRAAKIQNVVGFDIDQTAIIEAQKRIEGSDMGITKVKLFVGNGKELNDLVGTDGKLITPGISRKISELMPTVQQFHTISAMFSLHYMIETTWNVKELGKFLDQFLENGGYFMFTMFNGKRLHDQYLHDNSKVEFVDTRKNNKPVIFSIERMYTNSIENDNLPSPYGLKINVYIRSINVKHEEYLVDISQLILDLVANSKMVLIEQTPFSDKVNNWLELTPKNKLLPAEYEFLQLYDFVVMQKQETTGKTKGKKK